MEPEETSTSRDCNRVVRLIENSTKRYTLKAISLLPARRSNLLGAEIPSITQLVVLVYNRCCN